MDFNSDPHPYKWQISFSSTYNNKEGRKIVGSTTHVTIRLIDPAYGIGYLQPIPYTHKWKAPDIKKELDHVFDLLTSNGFIGVTKYQPSILYDAYYNVITGVYLSKHSKRILEKDGAIDEYKFLVSEYLCRESNIGIVDL